MQHYILLAGISFDWSGGEYGNTSVENIYLANGKFESEETAKAHATELVLEYCNKNSSAVYHDCYIEVKEIKF